MMVFYSKYKWLRLLMGVFFLLAGTLTVIVNFTRPEAIGETLSISLAIVFFLIGGISLIATLINEKRAVYTPAILTSSLLIALGVVLCIKRDLITSIIVYFAAVFAISIAIVLIIRGILLTRYKKQTAAFVTCFIIGGILLAAGIYALIQPGQVLSMMYVVAGVFLIVYGITEIVFGIKMLK